MKKLLNWIKKVIKWCWETFKNFWYLVIGVVVGIIFFIRAIHGIKKKRNSKELEQEYKNLEKRLEKLKKKEEEIKKGVKVKDEEVEEILKRAIEKGKEGKE